MKPNISREITDPFIRLDRFFSDTTRQIFPVSGKGTVSLVYLRNGDMMISSGSKEVVFPKGTAATFRNADSSTVTVPVSANSADGLIIEFLYADKLLRDLGAVKSHEIPIYEEDEIIETRISGKWGGFDIGEAFHASLFRFKSHASLSFQKENRFICILVLEGWVQSGHDTVMKDQIIIPDTSVNLDCRNGTELFFLSGVPSKFRSAEISENKGT